MPLATMTHLETRISALLPRHMIGRVCAVEGGVIRVTGLQGHAHLGDQLSLTPGRGAPIGGEVLQLGPDTITMLPNTPADGVCLGDRVALIGPDGLAPCDAWIGRVIDPFGNPLDGRPLRSGGTPHALKMAPPAPATRRVLGQRLSTGMAVLNTLLPIVRGQRVGLFAGSGVGKSSLLGHLARHMEADVVVIGLVGERGRELREFIENILGPEGMARAVVVAATSDLSPLVRRRCAWAAMATAEYFRDQGKHVLLLMDSITRFAEAHREVAVASGEAAGVRGFPSSTAHTIMSLCERAGPGSEASGGDITALFSVLVAGSDMEEPIADILRGVLDGHIILDRKIAERGRYPAIDLLRSVSRSLPRAATETENAIISETRQLLGTYDQSEMMIRAGLYVDGSDPTLDRAISIWNDLDRFLAEPERLNIENSFARLGLTLRRARPAAKSFHSRS